MAAENYGTFKGETCTGVIVLDPEQTDPTSFGKAIGATLVRVADYADGHWGAGATLKDGVLTPAEPEVVIAPELPEDYQAPISESERIANLETALDWVVSLVMDQGASA